MVHFVYFLFISNTYFVIVISIAQYFAQNGRELTPKTKSNEKSSDKQINWKCWLCHSTGQAGDPSNCLE
jgi:hypothetical protein